MNSTFDIDRFQKVWRLAQEGAFPGERAAAKARAEAIAAAAGMTLEEALSNLDAPPKPGAFNFFAGFDDWMEQKEPGWKAEQARKRAERNRRDDLQRAQVLKYFGSEKALFTRTAWESALASAIEPLATWDYWTDGDGVRHRYADSIDGKRPSFWGLEQITPAIRKAVITAYPWPTDLGNALLEVMSWDRLRWDRGLFNGGEWQHYAEVEIRLAILEHELNAGRPAASWDDVQARFEWKRYEHERQWIEPTERKDAFLDRLEADFQILRDLPRADATRTRRASTRRPIIDPRQADLFSP